MYITATELVTQQGGGAGFKVSSLEPQFENLVVPSGLFVIQMVKDVEPLEFKIPEEDEERNIIDDDLFEKLLGMIRVSQEDKGASEEPIPIQEKKKTRKRNNHIVKKNKTKKLHEKRT
jgi:hypothetical protein